MRTPPFALVALAVLALAATLALPRLRAAQPDRPATSSTAAAAAKTPLPTATPNFVQPGEVAPPPGSPTPAPEHATAVADTPEQAVRDYVALAGNWTAATVVTHYRQLAARTIGPARLRAQEMVARIPIDPTYTTRRPSLATEVAGVVRRSGDDETPTFLVVIRQQLSMKGAPTRDRDPGWQVATAALSRDHGRVGRDPLDGPARVMGALRLPQRARRDDAIAVDPVYAHTRTPGDLVAVCGLHGGAGTTTLAAAIADAAAHASGPNRVLLADTDPAGGGLADHYATASPSGLHDLARRPAAQGAPFAVLPSGLRLLARDAGERTAAAPADLVRVLEGARAAHPLLVVDAGTVREPHNTAALATAGTIIWAIGAERADRLAALLASPLTRRGRAARWIVAVRPHSAHQVNLRSLQAAAPTAHAIVTLPGRPDGLELAAALAGALRP